jgi:hypothetical protein
LTNVKHDVNSPATFLRWVCPRRCLVDHSTVPGRLLIWVQRYSWGLSRY